MGALDKNRPARNQRGTPDYLRVGALCGLSSVALARMGLAAQPPAKTPRLPATPVSEGLGRALDAEEQLILLRLQESRQSRCGQQVYRYLHRDPRSRARLATGGGASTRK
mgnify:CR=1 FL=1